MGDITIDGKLFQERISHFVNAWKADKRAGDSVFAGASSIIIMMGKVEETPEFHKNNAMHVSRDKCRPPPRARPRLILEIVLAIGLRVSQYAHVIHA